MIHVINMLLAMSIQIMLVTWINEGRQSVLTGALVSWKSTLKSTVALSNTEVEYMALTEVVRRLFG